VPYLSVSEVVIHYEEALYQVYAPLLFTFNRQVVVFATYIRVHLVFEIFASILPNSYHELITCFHGHSRPIGLCFTPG